MSTREKATIYQMYQHQVPIKVIAERTGYSERHVRRHIDSIKEIMRPDRDLAEVRRVSRFIRHGQELALWMYYRSCGYSYDKLSLAFGRSRQAIQQSLNNNS